MHGQRFLCMSSRLGSGAVLELLAGLPPCLHARSLDLLAGLELADLPPCLNAHSLGLYFQA